MVLLLEVCDFLFFVFGLIWLFFFLTVTTCNDWMG
jgi:hypothetical protein